MRKQSILVSVLALGLSAISAHADNYAFGFSYFDPANNITINGNSFNNIDSGWINFAGVHDAGNKNYFSGNLSGVNYENYFSFDLSGLTGNVSSAAFNVGTFQILGSGWYNVYATTLNPAAVNSNNGFTSLADYNALVSGPVIGTIGLTPGDSYSFASIAFNSAGLNWLQNNEGRDIVLGGEFSQTPPASPNPVPEPATLLMVGSGLAAMARKFRHKLL